MNNKTKIDAIVKKINVIYKEIKKNEIAPKDNYLLNEFNSPPKTSFDKTIKQLEKMNEVLNQTGISITY